MFIKNPNQKESYSFRIKTELLENLRAYAKATNQSLPETLNNLLEEAIDGVNTSNTFLTDKDGIIINIPLMYHTESIINLIDTTDTVTVFKKGTSNYLDDTIEGLTYEVKQIPNNLDTWSKTAGYYCNENGIQHKGVNFVIVPELILNPNLYITGEAITNCLKFLLFEVQNDNTTVTSISYKDCFRRLKEAGNEEVLYKFRGIDNTLYKFSLAFMKDLEKDPDIYTRYDNYRVTLYNELVKIANRYNDNTIVSLEEVLTEELENSTPEEVFEGKPKSLVFTTDSIITEVLEENQTLQNRVNELEGKFDKITELMEEIKDLETRLEVWDDLKD